ncbi:nucleotidyltransferase family protein [Micrococcus sp. EYE_162]|uniref:nucleotidyltransferase family protein n=1 Tax=unclassified Micrococcus TaxID=2620948 RepID=UPI002006882B|nr:MULTISPECIES: nucleotidyltransferase family protein [unclassified Micrococcus]MCK6094782.1 nucleotidyltransferase family protein [Micrococcus sp. EYE_212]MCK6171845.1 nucleotidyltransferase family protein [Micrococcus sp. EYE_162]
MTGVSPSSQVDAVPPLELRARVHLAHARIAHILEQNGVRGLHVKGYAMDLGVYREARSSSDVDLLVHPSEAEHVLDLLTGQGWNTVAAFSEGSIFEHAATLWHDHLGYVDVHRLFPGLGSSDERTFEQLWAEHRTRVIAGRAVPVPSLRHQRLIVLVHGARDPYRGAADVAHLRETLSDPEWTEVREQAEVLGATAAWHVATDEDAAGMDEHDLTLFTALRSQESGMQLFTTRWRAAESTRERAALVLHTLPVNRPHLQMRLGRPPTRADILREQAHRAGALAGWIREKAVSRGR